MARDTVRKMLRSGATEFSYKREVQPLPKLGARVEVLNGILEAEAAQMRLAHSRVPFVRTCFRETQEMVFDAHDRAFAFYGGVCRRGIYDNLKAAVETVFVGRTRTYNRRFLQLCSHHLVEPVACTPAAG